MRLCLALAAWMLLCAPALAVPRLMVVVSVDQMRADYLDRFASEFSGGFKLLREQGAVFTDAHHAHIPTETAPGHAVILTGRFPEQTGIVGNSWWDRQAGAQTYCVADSVHGRGPEHLLSYTLGDILKAQNHESRVISISLKDRSAILLGGKRPDAALWYDKKQGEFVTSSYYPRPDWLDKFNRGLKAKGGVLFERDGAGYGELIYEPAADRITLDLAQEALRRFKLGRRDGTDLLAIGFSGTDSIGHRYGPESSQIHDQLLSLDAELGELFETLDERVGRGRWDLALTADHGVMPRPEDPAGKALGIRRVMFDAVGPRLEKALQYQFPAKGAWVVSEYPNIYLNRALAKSAGFDWPVFLRQAASVMKAAEGMAMIYVADEIDPADPFAEVYRRSFFPGRSGDLLVRVKPDVLVTDRPTGADHGTPYPNDTRVPLVFYGPDFKPGRVDGPAWVADLAPTLAALLGLDLPPAPGARVHGEIFAKP